MEISVHDSIACGILLVNMADRIFTALEFAVQAHNGQYRKGSRLPYIIHPLQVAELLIRHQASEPLVVAALLHDTVEDTPVTLAQIEAQFGPEIRVLVAGLSEPHHQSDPWQARKQHTIDHLRTASQDILLVACADKLANVQSMLVDLLEVGDELWAHFNAPKERQAWYYNQLAEIFQQRLIQPPGSTLARTMKRTVQQVFPD